MTYTAISSTAFETLQLNAGVLLKTFNPSSPAVTDDAIICATTGGINATCIPQFSDLAEDVDNAMNGLKEFKHLDSWDCKLAFTALTVDAETIKLALGACDTSGNKITPRRDVQNEDFVDEIWWVGDSADGGAVAVCLKNVLSTGGFSLQTGKNEKGKLSVELTGHVSSANQQAVPMEFYKLAKT